MVGGRVLGEQPRGSIGDRDDKDSGTAVALMFAGDRQEAPSGDHRGPVDIGSSSTAVCSAAGAPPSSGLNQSVSMPDSFSWR